MLNKKVALKENNLFDFFFPLDKGSDEMKKFFASILKNPILAKQTLYKQKPEFIVDVIIAFENMQMEAIDKLFNSTFLSTVIKDRKNLPGIEKMVEYLNNTSISILKLNLFDFNKASNKINNNDNEKEYWKMNTYFFNEMFGKYVSRVEVSQFRQIIQLWMASISFLVGLMVDAGIKPKKAAEVFGKLSQKKTISCTKINLKYIYNQALSYKNLSDLMRTPNQRL